MSVFQELSLKKLAALPVKGEPAIQFPLKHTAAGMVFDANNNHVLDVRGWGRIQHEKFGADIHDAIADRIVEVLNSLYETSNK